MPLILDFVFDHTIAITCGFVALYFILCAIYQLCFSPLCDIPGPWYAAISDLWLTTHVVRLQQCRIIDTLFKKYGPVVRVGPNKVVFNDISTTKSVYSTLKFDKSAYYKSLLTNDNDHAMTTLPHASHVFRKKGYAPHYTPASIAQFQQDIHQTVLELVNIIDGVTEGNAIDCLAFFRYLMADVATSSSFGSATGALSKWATNIDDPLVTAIGDFPKRGIVRSAVPAWTWKLVCSIPNRRWRQLCNSDRVMTEFVSARVYETRLHMVSGSSEQSDRIALVHRLIRHYSGSSTDNTSDRDIISEHIGHLIGACDTSSTTLSYLCWELSRRSDVARKLQAELDTTMPDCKMLPDISILQGLPYLNAFIKEGLRLYGAAPSLLERVVPDSNVKTDMPEAFDLMGYALPSGTIVATQGWTVHRQNLAQMVLRIAVAAIARNFDLLSPPETTEKSMEMRDSFVIFPASMTCHLIFNARKNR
ncbi:cytochrome P450 [Lactifluus volemus]|nr:cytochrome P450 [Lactifluus volemus]